MTTRTLKVEEIAYDAGYTDGYAGNSYKPQGKAVPPFAAGRYASGYYKGYYDGQLAYRRTLQ